MPLEALTVELVDNELIHSDEVWNALLLILIFLGRSWLSGSSASGADRIKDKTHDHAQYTVRQTLRPIYPGCSRSCGRLVALGKRLRMRIALDSASPCSAAGFAGVIACAGLLAEQADRCALLYWPITSWRHTCLPLRSRPGVG